MSSQKTVSSNYNQDNNNNDTEHRQLFIKTFALFGFDIKYFFPEFDIFAVIFNRIFWMDKILNSILWKYLVIIFTLKPKITALRNF